MNKNTSQLSQVLADNLRRLLANGAAHGLPTNQSELARRSGVSQKTISNWLDPSRGVEPVLGKLAQVAQVYKLDPWQLILQHLPDDWEAIRQLRLLVRNYQQIQNPEARRYLNRIAEAEAGYKRH